MTLDAQPAPPLSGAAVTDATLIFNSNAGGSGRASPDRLVEALYQQGYRPVYRATDDEADLAAALQEARGTVFVAGGDGTVRAVALRLAGRPGLRLGILPMGTANNVGRTLGVAGDPLDVIASYAGAGTVPLDLGRVWAPWGEDLFLEACGCGAFAEVLAEYDPEGGKSPLRAVGALTSTLGKFDPLPLALTLDGQPQPEVPYALVEVMNTRATGPRLKLATTADPTDGQLNVIRVDAGGREGLLAYLAALARDSFEELSSVENVPVRRIEIPYVGQAFHVDGEVRPAQPGVRGVVRVEVWPGALSVLVPRQQEG
ncbi:diacylglycerol kinase family lipid kinase [Deinococcus metallilatus]|uniref:Diacylglycerol kinase family enzyme n=1 Tax=Deinococcus metallilatus TaxID=1211322 RepID=A0AAJ5F2L9_9DEIO|nr:diacylglycerol kinase family protein [Deinococcus metallilatus]MBB5296248.1 diacylglycerol kinase family enzyme [Deinococcus metallilatus]QBY09706.1 diacylglycerol kinase family lipid kinase [Deinococcus metallilatus]RXJ08904.1 diacylglycerol kinase family lipid kinase [Deinococcus metallilatus]TLK23717.1 diacylglycerol kinase family lipid kinase [Deinococcus metallilatus]GMA14113.1 diacylglycerol kinase [Deinococcus metallilatus]